MEKPKNNNVPIDPLLAQKYFADAAQKARGIIEWPAHEVVKRTEHELVPVSNPDREAERKASEAHQDFQTMKNFYDNETDAMRGVKETRDLAAYAESIGENPDTYSGPMFRGTTENLVGDSKNSVFTKIEDQLINSREKEMLESTDKATAEFLDKLPSGNTKPKLDRREFRRALYGIEPLKPYDQDAPEKHDAA